MTLFSSSQVLSIHDSVLCAFKRKRGNTCLVLELANATYESGCAVKFGLRVLGVLGVLRGASILLMA